MGVDCSCVCCSLLCYNTHSKCFILFCNLSRLLRVVYGPPEESDARQGQVTTLANNLRNTGGDVEIGPCGEYWLSIINHASFIRICISLLVAHLFVGDLYFPLFQIYYKP